jgi:hypothetical protein
VVIRQKGIPGGPPLIQMGKFTARGNILGLWARHVSFVRLEGLDINIPPKGSGHSRPEHRKSKTRYIVVDEIIADGAKVSTTPRDSRKKPLEFHIKRLRMQGASSSGPLSFEAY